jgi:S-formylglutathione hydrolase FrmB
VKIIKYLFYLYVIFLAGYGTYQALGRQRLSRPHVNFIQPKKECFIEGDWTYCVHTNARTNYAVYLYALHGKDQSENYWLAGTDYPALLQSYWQEKQKEIPVVITVSFGPVWLATPKMSKPKTGLIERFRNEVFPTVEKQLGAPSRRFLVGGSMGALNSLSLALEFQNHFEKIALLCPPLFNLSPYAGIGEIYHFLGRTGATPKSLITILGLGRMYFENDEEWKRFSPLRRVQSQGLARHQKYYVSAGLHDQFGLFEGTQQFVKALRDQNIFVNWRPSTSHHCGGDIPSLGEFLAIEKRPFQEQDSTP